MVFANNYNYHNMEQDWNLFFSFVTSEPLYAMFATVFVTEQIS